MLYRLCWAVKKNITKKKKKRKRNSNSRNKALRWMSNTLMDQKNIKIN